MYSVFVAILRLYLRNLTTTVYIHKIILRCYVFEMKTENDYLLEQQQQK